MNHPEVDHVALHNFEADAVCERCSTVNPSGTLLCKTCGNNLREQRELRLSSGPPADLPTEKVATVRILTGLLTGFGILVVIWAGINSVNGNIERWLVNGISSAEAARQTDPEIFWTGEDAEFYNGLLADLEANPVTEVEAEGVPIQGSLVEPLDGRYVLKSGDDELAAIIGSAYFAVEGDMAYFVATLNGGAEVRGSAVRTEGGNFEAEQAGVRINDRYLEAFGVGRIGVQDTFYCYGSIVSDDTNFVATAYRLP